MARKSIGSTTATEPSQERPKTPRKATPRRGYLNTPPPNTPQQAAGNGSSPGGSASSQGLKRSVRVAERQKKLAEEGALPRSFNARPAHDASASASASVSDGDSDSDYDPENESSAHDGRSSMESASEESLAEEDDDSPEDDPSSLLSSEDELCSSPSRSYPRNGVYSAVDRMSRLNVSCGTPSKATASRRARSAERSNSHLAPALPSDLDRPPTSNGRQQSSSENNGGMDGQKLRGHQPANDDPRFTPCEEVKLSIASINLRVLRELVQLKKSDKLGHVYMREHESLAYIKFGSAEDSDKRRKEHKKCDFKTRNHEPSPIPIREFRSLEMVIQAELANHRGTFPCTSCKVKERHKEIYNLCWDELCAVVWRWYRWFKEVDAYEEDGKLHLFWFHKAHQAMDLDFPPSPLPELTPAYAKSGEVEVKADVWAKFTKLRFKRSDMKAFEPDGCKFCMSYSKGEWPDKKKDETPSSVSKTKDGATTALAAPMAATVQGNFHAERDVVVNIVQINNH